MTSALGIAALTLTDGLDNGSPFSTASTDLLAAKSTTPAETINLNLVVVKDVTTANDGSAT
jgi:hypothetical protein